MNTNQKKLQTQIKSGSIWLSFRFVITAMLSAVTMPLIARSLEIDTYGTYNILFALISWISLITGFGIPHVLQRFIPESLQKKNLGQIKLLIKKCLAIRLMLSISAIIFIIFFSEYLEATLKINGWRSYFFFFSFGIICVLEIKLLEIILNGLMLQKYAVIANVCWAISRTALLTIFVLWDKSLKAILLAETLSWVMWLILLSFFLHKFFFTPFKAIPSKPIASKRMIRYGGYSFLSEIGVSVLDRATDLFVITIFLGPASAGIYGFCDRVVKLIQRIMPHAVLRDIIRPVFFVQYAKTKNTEDLSKMFNFLMTLAGFFLFPVCIGVCILGKEFILYVFGEKYLPAYPSLCIIVGFIAINVFSDPASYILKSLEKVNILFYSKIFAIYNLIGDLLVVKHFGIEGIAVVTSSALLFKNLFCLFFAQRYTGITIRFGSLVKIAINTALTGSILYFLKSSIYNLSSFSIIIFFGASTYLFLSWCNNAFNQNEKQIIKKLVFTKLR